MSVLRGCSGGARSLRRNARISQLSGFVDSLVKWSRSDGASDVLFGPLESNKSAEHLFFFFSFTDRVDVCTCLA